MKPGRPSATALLIARSTVVLGNQPRFGQLVPRAAACWCAVFVRDHMRLARLRLGLYGSVPYRVLAGLVEARTLPGIQLHYAARKRWIEATVRAALAEGFRDVRVVGAGFDTLSLRLAEEHPGANFLEIDHPDTQAAKRRSVEARAATPANLAFQPFDLADAGAAEGTYRPGEEGRGTVVVAEGVLMYLEEEDVLQFFRRQRREIPGTLRIVFTFMAPDARGRIRFHNSSRWVDRWLDLKGETFRWGIAPVELDAFMGKAGFRLIETIGHEELRDRYLGEFEGSPPQLAEGEMLALAEAR